MTAHASHARAALGAAISCEHLSHSYAGQPVLADVSFAASAGELLAIVGPSGSGKSTLLAIAGGLLRPDAGTVRVGGVELASAPERARSRLRAGKIGFVFQGANVAPFLNVGAMLALSARLAGRPRSEARRDVAQLLDAVGLADRGRALPGELSGGERQRLALAAALAKAPEVLLADEPTSALDSERGRATMTLLRQLARARGTAVVLSTHDERMLDLADRVLHLSDGQIAEAAPA